MSELHSAVASSNLHAVKQLLSENNLDVNARDYSGALAFAPLHVAARRGDVKVIRALIADARVDIEAKDATKCTALRHAMGTGQLAAASENPASTNATAPANHLHGSCSQCSNWYCTLQASCCV